MLDRFPLMLPTPLRWAIVPVTTVGLITLVGITHSVGQDAPPDRLHDLQNTYVETKAEPSQRAYHFGSQEAGDVFSNHTSHTNRLIPVYTFGSKADLSAILGPNSPYRTPAKVEALYGHVPEHTVHPEALYGDQADLYRLQQEAVAQGAKHLFIVWFDGLDWDATRAAAIAKTGEIYTEGKGHGLIFQDYPAEGTARFGFVVTSPTHDSGGRGLDVNTQEVGDLSARLTGGYDPRLAGPNPWTRGTNHAAGYIKGQGANDHDRAGVEAAGGVLHAYADSSCTAAEFASGVKSYNNGVNVAPDGTFVPTLFNDLQGQGWKVGTVTSVPISHASPTAMYAHNVSRGDYQDLTREMVGLESIVQQTGKFPPLPGLDVVIGTGWGQNTDLERVRRGQGDNAVDGNPYITDDDLKAIDVEHGGKYVVSQRTEGVNGNEGLQSAAERAARDGLRLFGFYGTAADHLPYRTANGDYLPSKGIGGVAERYQPADLEENPSLADMTRAALTVVATDTETPFALFVEAGDTDWALHDNNLDNAIGTVYDGEDAIQVIIDWVEEHSNWDDSVLIVTADHGHYLVLDDPAAIAGAAKETVAEAVSAGSE